MMARPHEMPEGCDLDPTSVHDLMVGDRVMLDEEEGEALFTGLQDANITKIELTTIKTYNGIEEKIAVTVTTVCYIDPKSTQTVMVFQ